MVKGYLSTGNNVPGFFCGTSAGKKYSYFNYA